MSFCLVPEISFPHLPQFWQHYLCVAPLYQSPQLGNFPSTLSLLGIFAVFLSQCLCLSDGNPSTWTLELPVSPDAACSHVCLTHDPTFLFSAHLSGLHSVWHLTFHSHCLLDPPVVDGLTVWTLGVMHGWYLLYHVHTCKRSREY